MRHTPILRHVDSDGLSGVARLGVAGTGCRPFRANHFVAGRVPRALPWADGLKPFGLKDGARSAHTIHLARGNEHHNCRPLRQGRNRIRACPPTRQRRNDAIAQGNALGTRAIQTHSALKGRNAGAHSPRW